MSLRRSLLSRPLRHVGSRLHTARRSERVIAQRWHPQRPRKRTRDKWCAARQHRDFQRRHASLRSRTPAASAASEKKDTRQVVCSQTAPRSSKTARLATFAYSGSHSSDLSSRPLRIESPPAAESSNVIANERETRSWTLLLTSAPTTQKPPDSASQPAPPRTSFNEMA